MGISRRSIRTVRWLLAAGLLAGCVARPAQVGGTKARRAGASAAPASAAPAALASPPADLFASPAPGPLPLATPAAGVAAAPIVANNGAGLAGKVLAPTTLLANNGAGIIGNHGGAIVSNNGGAYRASLPSGAFLRPGDRSYRLAAAAAQVPVGGARVRLVDATGAYLRGADGEPVVAETDAAGAYRFPQAPADRAWIVTAELPGAAGRLRALAPSDAADRAAVDVDYVSTLTTVYVLERYVATQPDRAATLGKLPAAVEAETRVRAAAALEAAGAPPPALDDAAVLAVVEGLRAKDPGLDAQLEAVKRLLIPAGQSDLGAGRPATEVALGRVTMLLAEPDGGLLLACEQDRRVWRLGPDGRLTTLAGGGGPTVESVHGQPAAKAGLTAPTGVVRDAKGRAIILEEGYDDFPVDRVTRVEADGTLTELWYDSRFGVAAVPGAGDEVLVLRGGMLDEPAELVAIAPDRTRAVRHTFPADRQPLIRAVERYGRDDQGRLWLGADVRGGAAAEGQVVYALDPATGALTRVLSRTADGLQGLSVDAAGNAFYLDAARRLLVRTPAGAVRELLAAVPPGFALAMDGVALRPDGTAFVAQGHDRVYRVADGALALVAGTTAAGAGEARDLALVEPSGVAPLPDGGMYVADAGLHRILRVDAAGAVTSVAGTGEAGFAGDGGPATAAKLDMPRTLRLDAAGNLYFIDNDGYDVYRVRRLGTDGRLETRYTSEDTLSDLVVEPDGTAYVADHRSVDFMDSDVAIRRIPAEGAPEVIVPAERGFQNLLSLALGPKQELFILNAGSQVVAWLPGMDLQLTTVGGGKGFLGNDDSGFVIDAAYRFYFADRDANVVIRWDPKAKAFETIAGPGGRRFTGTGVDDGLLRPGHLAFGPDGALLIVDTGHKQVKRVPADAL